MFCILIGLVLLLFFLALVVVGIGISVFIVHQNKDDFTPDEEIQWVKDAIFKKNK